MSEDGTLASFSRQPSVSGHLIFFYDNTAYRFNVLFEFLRAGLKRGQICIYHNAQEKKHRLLDRMMKFGLNYDRFGTRLVISNGSTISSHIEESLATLKSGRGIRAVSNAQEYFHSQNKPSKIIEQENVLHELASQGRVSVLCAYDSRWFNRPSWFRVFPPIIRMHNRAAFASAKGTIVMRELNATETGGTR